MKKFRLSQSILASELIPYGIEIEFDLTNSKMKLTVSDKNLEKFRCDLLEEDYPMDYPDTTSILEIVIENSMFSIDQKIDIFSTIQSEQLIFGYFEYQVLKQMGIKLTEILCYKL
jgi:hypothetical protein